MKGAGADRVLRLPRLSQNIRIVDDNGVPTAAFTQYWQQFASQIEQSVNRIEDALEAAGIAQQAAESADQKADAAQAQADQATADAEAAQQRADDAQAQADAQKREAALQGSYISPSSALTASPTEITIAPHTRYYADSTSVMVNGATVPATATGDTDYVSYNDLTRAGGAVTYLVSTTAPVQTGDTHVVGAVTIPATGTQPGGRGPTRPGYVEP